MNKIIQGDCLDKLKDIPDNSIDSIVTDPPYELGFMGKSWDKTGIANNVEMWKECLRVLKPGGHLLSFGGTRTYHRMACAIEDAGFEVRDMISWIYGSGFPKSLNIGKAVDKLQGNERNVVGEKMGGTPQTGLYEAGLGVNEGKYIKVTKGNSEWEGWGTALKPACEPCVLARKPLSEKTIAENVLKWGTGGINIDGSRVEIDSKDPNARHGQRVYDFPETDNFLGGLKAGARGDFNSQGRFPANLIHDGSDEVLGLFPNTKSGGGIKANKKTVGLYGIASNVETNFAPDSGSASRFFYCAKTSKSERNKGCEELGEKKGGSYEFRQDGSLDGQIPSNKNNHPTVKPQALMKYLIKLITPPGGTVLDPFAGSGSTLVAAKDLGHNYIGIEMTEEYIPIIEARLNYETYRL